MKNVLHLKVASSTETLCFLIDFLYGMFIAMIVFISFITSLSLSVRHLLND